MINSLKNEADIAEKFGGQHSDIGRIGKIDKHDREVGNSLLNKCTSHAPSSNFISKTTELESFYSKSSHNNNHLKYSNESLRDNKEGNNNGSRYGNTLHANSNGGSENSKEELPNRSYELSHEGRIKNAFNSTPLAPSGPVRLPYITSGNSPIRNEIGANPYHRLGAHHHSISDSSNYAIGAGKTVSSCNLKATVSGGKFMVEGGMSVEKRERIQMKCGATGDVTKISPSKINQSDGDPHYNHFYHKFRHQQKALSIPEQNLRYSSPISKNKFPLPFTGVEYPFIDGGGITSSGREGIYADNKPHIQKYNEFEKGWLSSLPDRLTCTPNDRPNYNKKID